jgi:hypothetical protein
MLITWSLKSINFVSNKVKLSCLDMKNMISIKNYNIFKKKLRIPDNLMGDTPVAGKSVLLNGCSVLP